jgi:fibronectin type 3 domain-containing protein
VKKLQSSVRRRAWAVVATLAVAGTVTATLASVASAAPTIPTTTKLTSSVSTSTYGSPVTLTAKVGVGGLGLVILPTGSVTFTSHDSSGTHTLGIAPLSTTCIVNPCVATLTTSALGAGMDTVTATYPGTSTLKPSSSSVQVRVNQPPTAPQSLNATAGDAFVNLSWTPPASNGTSPVANYTVYRSTSISSQGSALATVTGTSYHDTGVTNGTTYYYVVAANNATNAGPVSIQASATPTAGPPGAPTLSSPTSTLDHLSISWTQPQSTSPITQYTIYRGTSAGGETLLTTVPAGTTSYQDNVTAPTRYYYKVSATNGAGEGTASNEVNGVPGAPSVPCAPSLTASSQVGSTKMHWTTSCTGGRAITGYNLYRADASAGPYTQIASALPTGDYQDTTAIVGKTYYYQATATNVVGESPRSNTASTSATPYSGASSFTSNSCAAGSSCSTTTVTGNDPQTGNNTDGSMTVTSSTGTHTESLAIGGPIFTGCTSSPSTVGLMLNFNDTSSDGRKTVNYVLHGSDASTWFNTPISGAGNLCLGLGTLWYSGSPSNPATWVPSDGLYEARMPLCVNNGAFSLGGGLYSQPCYQESYNPSTLVDTLSIQLPPGDGKIGGGH